MKKVCAGIEYTRESSTADQRKEPEKCPGTNPVEALSESDDGFPNGPARSARTIFPFSDTLSFRIPSYHILSLP